MTKPEVSQRWPGFVRRMIRAAARRQLPDGYPIDVHFRPAYDPWDQRLCVVPDGDLFRTIREGRVEVVTDSVESFTEHGIRVARGVELSADVVVTATGFNLHLMGGVELSLDGDDVDLSERMAYRGLMFGGIPNFVFTIGYTHASWTLKADQVADFVCRRLSRLDRTAAQVVVPVPDPDVRDAPFLDITPGYVMRSLDRLPKQGAREPWRLRQNYLHDVRTIRRGDLDDGTLAFH